MDLSSALLSLQRSIWALRLLSIFRALFALSLGFGCLPAIVPRISKPSQNCPYASLPIFIYRRFSCLGDNMRRPFKNEPAAHGLCRVNIFPPGSHLCTSEQRSLTAFRRTLRAAQKPRAGFPPPNALRCSTATQGDAGSCCKSCCSKVPRLRDLLPAAPEHRAPMPLDGEPLLWFRCPDKPFQAALVDGCAARPTGNWAAAGGA